MNYYYLSINWWVRIIIHPCLVDLSPCLRPIRDAIFYRLSGVHQFFMAAQRRTLKEGADRPAAFIERHNYAGGPARALVGIRNDVSTPTKGAGMSFVSLAGALETFFKGKPPALIPACGKSHEHERG